MARRDLEPVLLLLVCVGLLVLSGIDPRDRFTWWLEVGPVLIGAPILVATYPRFPLTPLLYRLLFLHAAIPYPPGSLTVSGDAHTLRFVSHGRDGSRGVMKSLVFAITVLALTAGPAMAFQCPLLIKQLKETTPL